MSEELERLARRAVAAGWKWAPGAADTRGGRVVERLTHAGGVKLDRPSIRYAGPNGGASWHAEDGFTKNGSTGLMALIPDLADRATLGCLEGLVCEAWRDPDAHLMRLTGLQTFGNWRMVGNPPAGVLGRMSPDGYPTRAEALVAALEAAPAREVRP